MSLKVKVLNFVQGCLGWLMVSVWLSGTIKDFAILSTINIVISFVIAVAMKDDSGKGWWREALEGGTLLALVMLGATTIASQSELGWNSMCPNWYILAAILVIWVNHGHVMGWFLRHLAMLILLIARLTDFGAGKTERVMPMLAKASLSGTGVIVLIGYQEASPQQNEEGDGEQEPEAEPEAA